MAANRIKLFAHYDKMRILEYLILYGPSHVNALANGVGIDPLKVSQFLKKMRDDEFVSYTKKGRFVFYEILTGVHKTAIECIRKRYQTLTDKRLF